MMSSAIGRHVALKINRQLGKIHPDYADMPYPVNYGYVPGFFTAQNEEQEAYLLGVTIPVESFKGVVKGIIRRENGKEIWVLAPEDAFYTEEDIYRQTLFIERFFKSQIVCG